VLDQLREFGLYCKANKCRFGVAEVGSLGFVINYEEVGRESDRISTIEDWPTPKLVREIQVLLGFANLYRRFIRKYAKITLPLTELLRQTETARAPRASAGPLRHAPKWKWTREAKLAFWKLKKVFTEAPIFHHFDPA